jgi:dienelactone hydrolase
MPPFDRRRFLESATAATAAALASGSLSAQETPADSMPPDMKGVDPPAADLGSLYGDVELAAKTHGYRYSFLGDRFKSLEDYKRAARTKVFNLFGEAPLKFEHRPQVLARQEFDDFVREKIAFDTALPFRVPAYVHLPKKLKRRAPAIIDLHSHGGMFLFGKEKVIDFGHNHPVMKTYHERNYAGRPTTTALVKRGYVVITIDAFMFGERRTLLAEDAKYGWERSKYSVEDADLLNKKCRAKESTVAKSLIYAGRNWPGVVTWDDIRTLDYLTTRPEVDPERIGCVGVSFGGWRSIFLGGLDDRIKAACIVGFMSTVKPMLKSHIDTHSFVHFLPGLLQWLDLPDVAALRAPLPLMVQQCKQDRLFPLAGMEAAVQKIAAIYDKAGAKDKFVGKFYDVPHEFNVEMQDEAFAWFDKQLA